MTYEGQPDDEGGLCIVVEWSRGQKYATMANESQYNDWLDQIGTALFNKYGKSMQESPELDTADLPEDEPADVVIHRSDSDNEKWKKWSDECQKSLSQAGPSGAIIVPTCMHHALFVQAWAAYRGVKTFFVTNKQLHVIKIFMVAGNSVPHHFDHMTFFMREQKAQQLLDAPDA